MGFCYVGMMTHWGSYYSTGFTFLTETGKRKNNFFLFFLICSLKILALLYICIVLPSLKCIGNWKFPRKYGVKKRLFKFLKTYCSHLMNPLIYTLQFMNQGSFTMY